MSQLTSPTPHQENFRKPNTHSHQSSQSTTPQPYDEPGQHIMKSQRSQQSSAPVTKPSSSDSKDIHYTLIVRLPFPRSTFQEPPSIEWTYVKDKALWQIISSGTTKDLDWQALSERFEAPLDFLLQQASWLYERHFEGMRKGMARLSGVPGSGAGSPVQAQGSEEIVGEGQKSSAVGVGGEAMRRDGSRGTLISPPVFISNADSSADSQKGALSITSRKPTPLQASIEPRPPPTPRTQHPGVSRTPSTATVTQSRIFSTGSRRPSQTQPKGLATAKQQHIDEVQQGDATPVLGHHGGSESESDDGLSHPAHSIRRSPLIRKPVLGTVSSDGDADDDEDDDDSGGFLPFAAQSETKDPAATVINPHQGKPSKEPEVPKTRVSNPLSQPQVASSSASSTTSSQPTPGNRASAPSTQSPSTLSPRQRAQLAQLSPRYKNAVSGSEGSPSMGSSFSDLDDLSVTQSALEDALLSHVQHGGSIGMGLGSLVSGRGRGNRNGNGNGN